VSSGKSIPACADPNSEDLIMGDIGPARELYDVLPVPRATIPQPEPMPVPYPEPIPEPEPVPNPDPPPTPPSIGATSGRR
jgi:hypothetical protein